MVLSSIPTIPYFVSSDPPLGAICQSSPVIWNFSIIPGLSWLVTASSRTNPSHTASAKLSLLEMPESITLSGDLRSMDGRPIEVTPQKLFDLILYPKY